ncbi:unnamed protein product [Periconia digitata]|uniref:ubiquitinyl hydrolase 1 n=1 Tax=Periconia digitata TaxID=1303443 RepID=A0A9W4XF34_9PLEO|nr:unnamed protein product [Periconia digitata]
MDAAAASATTAMLSAEATAYIVHHVVLPPKLPQSDDSDDRNELSLLDLTIQTLGDFPVTAEKQDAIRAAAHSIQNLRAIRGIDGSISESQLYEQLRNLVSGRGKGSMILEIKAQNAGLIASRFPNYIRFEVFELAPPNSTVMGTNGRLVRQFPDRAVQIPLSTMQSQDLQKTLSATISKMSTQVAPGFQPQVLKQSHMHDEMRDTTDPGMITDYLVNFLAAYGETTPVSAITKNTREEVLWDQTLHPWRRSSLWLLIRVFLHLHLARQKDGSSDPGPLYKAFLPLFLSKLIDSLVANWKMVGNDALYTTSAKILRRLRKMEPCTQTDDLRTDWQASIKAKLSMSHGQLKARQETSNQHLNLQKLTKLRPIQELDTTIPELNSFIDHLMSLNQDLSPSNFDPTSVYPQFSPGELPTVCVGQGENAVFQLAAIEKWAKEHLQSWISSTLHRSDTCSELHRLIKDYHASAKIAYADIPTSLSNMYLTLLELWVACDSSACAIYPLLRNYSPEVKLIEFPFLSLPFKHQMERADTVERYVRSREGNVDRTNPSIYRDFGHVKSFGVRFFDNSSEMKDLRAKIEREAHEKQQQKREELVRLKNKYNDLMGQYNEKSCDYEEVIVDRYHNYTEQRHKRFCHRCSLKNEADGIDIRIFEWPLSPIKSFAKATVFELQAPPAFSDWRDASIHVISDVLGSQLSDPRRPQNSYTLNNHDTLYWHITGDYTSRRIVPLSSVKPHSVTHRKKKGAITNLEEKDVCLDSALQYAYYDSRRGVWTGKEDLGQVIQSTCTRQMPSRSKSLQRYLTKSPSTLDGVPPNEVIANPSDCPSHLSVEEFRALATTPLGLNICYSNILVQLASPAVDFNKPETQTVILQTIHALGPPTSSFERITHRILTDRAFCITCLDQLNSALVRVSENWESWRAAASFAELSKRILSLSSSETVQTQAIEYLAKIRGVCMKWVRRLQDRIASSTVTSENQRRDLLTIVAEIALLGTSTFDIEENFWDVVFSRSTVTSTLFQFCIVVQELQPALSGHSEFGYHLRTTIQAWKSLMYRIFPVIRDKVLRDNSSLNDAIKLSWAAFQPHVKWKSQGDWLCIFSGALSVYYNLLTAELLVNGLPLSRLPSEYMSHNMYSPLFQKSTLEVVPTDEPGMRFSAKFPYYGYTLHFGMLEKDLLIVAKKDGKSLRLIPSRLLTGYLPHAFSNEYIHWYDPDQHSIVLRPIKKPWSTESTSTWNLRKMGDKWRLSMGNLTMIDMRGQTASQITRLLQPIEDPSFIHISVNTESQQLNVELPRLQLDFDVSCGKSVIHSVQYRGMVLDGDQNIGTLNGLESKLVLRNELKSQDRLVLIPEGCIDYNKLPNRNHRVAVTVRKSTVRKTHAYSIDSTLRQITDNGNLQSKLLLCYMHALTSHCLPDSLTGYTGVESALNILQSAAVKSFPALNEENTTMLELIGKLSPSRAFYPRELKVMQQIGWDDKLPALSQHPRFFTCVQTLFDQFRRMEMFLSNRKDSKEKASRVNLYLHERNVIRSSAFWVDRYGAESYDTVTLDEKYVSRKSNNDIERGQKAFATTRMILRNETQLLNTIPSLQNDLLKHFGQGHVSGTGHETKLSYDSEWLGKPTPILLNLWCSLCNHLTLTAGNYTKHDIASWLSTMAYSSSVDMAVVQVLAMLYKRSDIRQIQPPGAKEFNLSRGRDWNGAVIRQVVDIAIRSFESSAEARLPRQNGESKNDHKRRMKSTFQQNSSAAADQFIARLESQWPCHEPIMPTSAVIAKYINPVSIDGIIKSHFTAWSNNRGFLQYLDKLSSAVARLGCIGVPKLIILKPRSVPKSSQFQSRIIPYVSEQSIFQSTPAQIDRVFTETSERILRGKPPYERVPVKEESEGQSGQCRANRLQDLCKTLETMAESKPEKSYVENLRKSCLSLEEKMKYTSVTPFLGEEEQKALRLYLEECSRYLFEFNEMLAYTAATATAVTELGFQIQIAPRIGPKFWLSRLCGNRFQLLSDDWKTSIVEYGLAINGLQRAQRLYDLVEKPIDLFEELSDAGHTNWNPYEFPETLLLEAESGIMVREVQETIAKQMREPPNADNIICQLNMGEGKSSVIVPIVAASLTNSSKLVRVVVARPQSHQMFHMLVSKFGGLLDRTIYHMPFSRKTKLTIAESEKLRTLYEECLKERGILLIQPEHMLSFKLMGIDRRLSNDGIADSLLETQLFFDGVTRDIVDESDENFSVKFELVYTIGSARGIDFSPARWSMVQEVLSWIPPFAKRIYAELPDSVEILDDNDGKFPRIRILKPDATEQVLDLLAHHVVEHGLTGLPIRNQSPKVQAAVYQFLTQVKPTAADVETVIASRLWTDFAKSALLLVRGLLAEGILRFVLTSKRWRVNYGLDTIRKPSTKLAVPYRSKDSPSLQSEFSHPEVVITLTLLSYYYGGLSDNELFDAFAHVIRSDQSSIHYNEWVRTASPKLPDAFKQLSGISIKDKTMCIEKVFPKMRYSKAAIDYYLAHFIFPKEMKEFPHNMSASGWDIGVKKTHPTTGFSGTNDTSGMLPLSVRQLDVPSQTHTNALVLGYLLQDETSVEMIYPSVNRSNAENLLQIVDGMQPQVRVILDVGALILEMDNLQVAKAWLTLNQNSEAVIFFHGEALSVLDRSDRIEAFQTSPFAKQLDRCLVYLDESHTRGTDLKLPRDYRAAVTLGAVEIQHR